LAGIDFQTGVGQQVLTGGLITASQGRGAAGPADDSWRVAIRPASERMIGVNDAKDLCPISTIGCS
jgi:hypothetical protein